MKSFRGYICEDKNKKMHLIAGDTTLGFQSTSLCGIKINSSDILNIDENPFNLSDFVSSNPLPHADKICNECKKIIIE